MVSKEDAMLLFSAGYLLVESSDESKREIIEALRDSGVIDEDTAIDLAVEYMA